MCLHILPYPLQAGIVENHLYSEFVPVLELVQFCTITLVGLRDQLLHPVLRLEDDPEPDRESGSDSPCQVHDLLVDEDVLQIGLYLAERDGTDTRTDALVGQDTDLSSLYSDFPEVPRLRTIEDAVEVPAFSHRRPPATLASFRLFPCMGYRTARRSRPTRSMSETAILI